MLDKNEIIAILQKDIGALRVKEGYLQAGRPIFTGLFGRDSLISSLQILKIDPKIAEATLLRLADLQGKKFNLKKEEEPGKILHEYYEKRQVITRLRKWRIVLGWGMPYYGSVDSTPLWMIALGEYFKETKDGALLDKLWPNTEAAYNWILNIGDHNGDGFLDYQSHNKKALQHQAWKDSSEFKNFGETEMPVAPVEAQGYFYRALISFSELAKQKQEFKKANEALIRAQELKIKFLESFRVEDFFAFALDGSGRRIDWVTSNPGHLLLSGILDKLDALSVADRLFRDDMFTPYGLRTLSKNDANFDWRSYHKGSVWPHDNWFFWKGLKTMGENEKADKVKSAMLNAFGALGNRITELFAVDPKDSRVVLDIMTEHGVQKPCHPQAWASGALLDMLTSD